MTDFASAAALAVKDADEEMQWGSPEGLPRIPLQSQGSLRLRSQPSLKAYEASALLRTASFKVHHTCQATGGWATQLAVCIAACCYRRRLLRGSTHAPSLHTAASQFVSDASCRGHCAGAIGDIISGGILSAQ